MTEDTYAIHIHIYDKSKDEIEEFVQDMFIKYGEVSTEIFDLPKRFHALLTEKQIKNSWDVFIYLSEKGYNDYLNDNFMQKLLEDFSLENIANS